VAVLYLERLTAGDRVTAETGAIGKADEGLSDFEDQVISPSSPDEDETETPSDPMDEILAMLRDLVESAERYHTRAERRESVIDHLHTEVDGLRRGERRGLLRPLLVEICRLRHDLLRQAEDLPADFDADRSRLLLRSYAESVELALDNNGVVTFSPAEGDPFDPRMHRRVGGEPTDDDDAVGRIAVVRRDGYLDVDSTSPIALAEVVLFTRDERKER
jgi:molecular chaperone GrpE